MPRAPRADGAAWHPAVGLPTIAPMRWLGLVVALATLGSSGGRAWADDATRWADTFVDAVEKVNADHARRPAGAVEKDLAARLPAGARAAATPDAGSP